MHDPRVILRPEEPSDEAFSLRLFASTRAGEMACLAGAPAAQETFLRVQHQAQKRAYATQHPRAERSIVVIDGAPAGRIIVDRATHAGGEIRLVDIALLPEHRGKGTGTALLTSLLAEARAARKPITLHVLRGSPAARLYARIGFVRSGGDDMYDAMEWAPPGTEPFVSARQ